MKTMMMTVLFAGILSTGAIAGQADEAKEKGQTMYSEPVQKISGQCHCGNIKYEVTGAIVRCSYCDCRGCQRASGTLKVPFVTVHRENVKVTVGQLAEFRAEGGEKCDGHGVWQFCPKCGTQVFWKGNKGDELDVFAGTLDDTSIFQPKE